MSDPFRLDGKMALISGGTRGIALAIAKLFISQGARVIVSSESEAEDAVGTLGPHASRTSCDVTDWQACIDTVAYRRAGKLNILVCAAGIAGQSGAASASPSEYDRVIGTNLRGMVALTSAALPLMAEQERGSAILVGSIAASRGNGAIATYALAKAGVVQLARDLAVKWGLHGVTVKSVSPGLISIGFSTPLLGDEAS
jgi:NAD(P)-dependent dehydrogenase (short-subunit alcohol dehydrogenase family)